MQALSAITFAALVVLRRLLKPAPQIVAATLLFAATSAPALTLGELMDMPDELRFPYILGLADGYVAGQPDIATRNFLSNCITGFGMEKFHDELRRQLQENPGVVEMDTGRVARMVISAVCDAL